MATATPYSFERPSTDQKESRHDYAHLIQPTPDGTTVAVTQPVVTVPKPATTPSLVFAVLSAIFCCFICGLTGIFVAWKARLYVLEKKFEQARHSVRIVWIFFGLAILFGVITWGLIMHYIILPFHYRYHSY